MVLIDGYECVKMFPSTSLSLPDIIPPWDYPPRPPDPIDKSGEVPCQHLCRGQRIYTVKGEAMLVQCYIYLVQQHNIYASKVYNKVDSISLCRPVTGVSTLASVEPHLLPVHQLMVVWRQCWRRGEAAAAGPRATPRPSCELPIQIVDNHSL